MSLSAGKISEQLTKKIIFFLHNFICHHIWIFLFLYLFKDVNFKISSILVPKKFHGLNYKHVLTQEPKAM